MIDGYEDPIQITANVVFSGVVEEADRLDKMVAFQKELERWLIDTAQPMRVVFVEHAYGELDGGGASD